MTRPRKYSKRIVSWKIKENGLFSFSLSSFLVFHPYLCPWEWLKTENNQENIVNKDVQGSAAFFVSVAWCGASSVGGRNAKRTCTRSEKNSNSSLCVSRGVQSQIENLPRDTIHPSISILLSPLPASFIHTLICHASTQMVPTSRLTARIIIGVCSGLSRLPWLSRLRQSRWQSLSQLRATSTRKGSRRVRIIVATCSLWNETSKTPSWHPDARTVRWYSRF